MSWRHTAGPWFVDEDMRPGMSWNRHIHSGRNTAICFMAHSDGQAEEMDEANARLIAAAPDLLEALKALHGWCKAEIEHFDSTGPDEWIMEKALAAIAKATGEQP